MDAGILANRQPRALQSAICHLIPLVLKQDTQRRMIIMIYALLIVILGIWFSQGVI
jgi:hypothetical protein